MLQTDQRILSPVPPLPGDEISAAALLSGLEGHTAKTLIFNYEGRDVLPGYHVTEVKTGAFQALDCGANYETWHETFIQLWDIPQEDERRFMPVAKFLAIIRKVSDSVPFDPNAKLTFEVSDGKSAMQLYRASSIDLEADIVRVALTQRPASCKPRDRWLEQQPETTSSCCGPKTDAKPCCG
jgi:hypothetical protein